MRALLIGWFASCTTGGSSTPALETTTATPAPDCSWSTPAPADFEASLQPIAACAGGYPDLYGVEIEGIVEELAITVTESGAGERPTDCLGLLASDVAEHPWQWFRGTDASSRPWVFGWKWPDAASPPRAGEDVTVKLVVEISGPYVWSGGALDIRRDGALIVQVVDTEETTPPFSTPLPLQLDAEVGAGRNECGQWRYHDMSSGGQVIPYGSTTEIDGYTVFHGGSEFGIYTAGRDDACCCNDWWIAETIYALQPL